MINLLPPEEKIKLLLEKRKKLIIILGMIVLIPLFCLILILLSVKFYILGEVDSKKIILEQAEKEYQTPAFLTFKDIIQKNNKILVELESFYKKETYFSKALKIISNITRPKNLYLTNMSLDKNENYKIKVAASGFSKTREDLLIFQKNINEIKEIKNVNFSPESWFNSQDVRFYLTFEIN